MTKSAHSFLNNLPDIVAPAEARLRALLSLNAWLSYQARDVLVKSRRRKKGWLRVNLPEFSEKALQPENWWLLLVVLLLITFVIPEGLILFGLIHLPGEALFQNGANSQIVTTITTAWQVLASIIALTFVIVVFLLEFAQTRAFENRAFPLFAYKTRIVPIVIFEMLTLVSIGGNTVLFGNSAILQTGLGSLTEYNLSLFVCDIFLTIYLYVNTFRFINPRFFRQVFQQYNRQQVVKSCSGPTKLDRGDNAYNT